MITNVLSQADVLRVLNVEPEPLGSKYQAIAKSMLIATKQRPALAARVYRDGRWHWYLTPEGLDARLAADRASRAAV